MPKTRSKTITMKHLTVSLWNVQLACDAIRKALETMDPTGKSRIALPPREGRIFKSVRDPKVPRNAGSHCCPPPPPRRPGRSR